MSGTVFTLWLTVILCLVKMVAFFTLAAFDRTNVPARWLGLAFLASALSYGGKLALAAGSPPFATGLVIALAMAAAFLLIAKGLTVRYATILPRWILVAVLGGLAVYYGFVIALPYGLSLRGFIYQLPYVLLCLALVAIIFRAPKLGVADTVFIGLFALMAVQFIAEPFAAMALGGMGETAAEFSTTLHGAVFIAVEAVLLLTIATLVLGVMIYDSARVLIGRAERDSETALLNRDGFATHANRMLAGLNRSAPEARATLVIIALDAPPAHDASPVRALAAVVLAAVHKNALVGRVADGELAVICPCHDLFAARDAAETWRERAQVPLSIGIAEREPGDVYPQMLARALWALEEAQKAGGDCVRLAVGSEFGLLAPIRR